MTERDRYVYRVHCAHGHVLYVGMTCDPMQRWANHRSKHWAREAADIAVYGPYTLEDAAKKEAEAIRYLRPSFNVSENPLNRHRCAARREQQALDAAAVDDLIARGIGLPEAWLIVDYRRARVAQGYAAETGPLALSNRT